VACGSYLTPLVNVQALSSWVNPVFSLGAGSTLRNLNVAGGDISLKITGADVDVCAVGLGIAVGGDGDIMSLPPSHAALAIDGAGAIIHRNYINGPIVVSTLGGDSRIGDAIGGSGDGNDGVRAASVTVRADASSAAQRVTIRDPFPRGLSGLVGSGVSGGDDEATHANNWAQTPSIISAYSYDGFATAQVIGTANSLSLVDIYFDNQISVTRQAPVTADAFGHFAFAGTLPGSSVSVLVGSTLSDTAHLNRVGSSSQLSAPQPVTVAPAAVLQLAPSTLTFTATVGASALVTQDLWVTVPPISPTLQWQTSVTTTSGENWLNATPAGTGTGSLAVTVDPSGLAVGAYGGTVTAVDVAQPNDTASTAVTFVVQPAPTQFDIVESVTPAGQIKLGDELTYTLAVSATPAMSVAVYDPLEGMTFVRFVVQPPGVLESDNVITGSLVLTPTLPVTIVFVAQADWPNTAGTTITNRACVRAPGVPLSSCVWSNQTSNLVAWPYSTFLPMVMRSSP
jgi:hypothetical protein